MIRMKHILRVLFPKIIPAPRSQKEIVERRKKFVHSFIISHAEGNVSLSRGHYRLK